MRKINFIMFFFFALVLLSCGKKEESNSEFTEEKVGEPTDKTEESTDKKSSGEQQNKSSEQPKKQIDTVKSKENSSGELKFYSNTKPEAVISPLQAKDHIGRVVTVKGFVADVYKTDKVAYLNFVQKYPENPFSGVIFASKFKDFGDMNIYEGKNVELTGRITVYKEKPQIILDSPEQVKIQ